MVVLQEPVGLRTLGKADIAQEVRRAVAERHQLRTVAGYKKPGTQAAEPANARYPAVGKAVDFKRLSHGRLFRFLRPNPTYVSMVNLRSTFAPIKPILRGRA